jgi:hypothetical protein
MQNSLLLDLRSLPYRALRSMLAVRRVCKISSNRES